MGIDIIVFFVKFGCFLVFPCLYGLIKKAVQSDDKESKVPILEIVFLTLYLWAIIYLRFY